MRASTIFGGTKNLTMLSTLIESLGVMPFAARLLIIFIIAGFMPLSSMTFFYHMFDKREREFKKAVDDMGISSTKRSLDNQVWSHYLLPVFFVFLICFLAITYILFADQLLKRESNSLLLLGIKFGTPASSALYINSIVGAAYAFVGAFIWSATNIIRRLINADLSPYIYYSAGIRILMAMVVSILFSFILPDFVGNGLPVVAFLTGMFPERVLNFMIEKYRDIVGDRLVERELALERIDGISMAHKERLQEIGIDNAQNLACYSLIELLKRTPFEAREVLDWMGQAKLLLYVRDNIDAFRAIGIRSAFDFFKGDKSKEAMQTLAQGSGLNPVMVGLVYEQVVNDEGIKALRRFEQQINMPGSSTPLEAKPQ